MRTASRESVGGVEEPGGDMAQATGGRAGYTTTQAIRRGARLRT